MRAANKYRLGGPKGPLSYSLSSLCLLKTSGFGAEPHKKEHRLKELLGNTIVYSSYLIREISSE